MWDTDNGISGIREWTVHGDSAGVKYTGRLLTGEEVELSPWGNRLPSPEQFMDWAFNVSGLPGAVFQRADVGSRFDPEREFQIDRSLVAQTIIAGDIFWFTRSYWATPRQVMAISVTEYTVTALEERGSILSDGDDIKPRRTKGVRMLQLEDGT